MKIGFDNDKYLKIQSEHIMERIARFGGKLYLEFGGKLFDDYHASRVLPGFEPDSKIRMLKKMKDQAEIVIAVSSNDIEKNKVRGDIGITYDQDVLRLIDAFQANGLFVGSVVLTRFAGQPSAIAYEHKLKALGLKVYRHYPIEGYPSNVALIDSDEGFGKNDYVETERPLVVVTAPGPGSGKMAVCLSQLYNENKRGVQAGYAKFETFPVWNLPLNHPVNLAYEAATADLNDVNMIDPWHLEAYGEAYVNYNRDVEVFPVLRALMEGISGEVPYKSPTDMGVNMVGFCISDEEAVKEASRQEIIRRYYAALVDRRKGRGSDEAVYKTELLMKKEGLTTDDRKCVVYANNKALETGAPAAAMEMADGTVLTGKTSELLGSSSALLLNALKYLAGINDPIKLLAPTVIGPVIDMKINELGADETSLLHLNEILVALAIGSVTDSCAKLALDQLSKLRGLEAHSTVILSPVDEDVFKKLGVHLTSEPQYESTKLYHK